MHDILTLTLNPALDVSLSVTEVQPIHKLRCSPGEWQPGGGGVNVARVAHRLGSKVLAIYPSGGIIGQELQALLTAESLPQLALNISQETRQNFSVHETSTGRDFRFVLPGPTLSEVELERIMTAFEERLACSSYAVLSGSLPPGVPQDIYAQLARRAQARGHRVMLDASGEALRHGLQAGVQLVKPSLRELAELTGQPLETESQWREAAAWLVDQQQAEVVALSLGEAGAMVVTRHHHWRSAALPVTVRSTIGAGDSFVGGWLHGLSLATAQGADEMQRIEAAFRWAMATAASAVSSLGTALCNPVQVQHWLPLVRIERL